MQLRMCRLGVIMYHVSDFQKHLKHNAHEYIKLMRLDLPWAKFSLILHSNQLLIHFFDSNSWNQIKSLQWNWLNLVRFISKSWFISKIDWIWSKMSKLIKNAVVFDLFRSNLIYFRYKLTIFDKIINIKTIFWSFNRNWSKKDQNQSIVIKIRLKLDRNPARRFDLVVEIRIRLKSMIEFGFRIQIDTTIPFERPNRISLEYIDKSLVIAIITVSRL